MADKPEDFISQVEAELARTPANDTVSGGLTMTPFTSPENPDIIMEMTATSDEGHVTSMRFTREAIVTLRALLGNFLNGAADLPDTFVDFPMTITEARGELNGDSDSWTPRDVLIAALRDLDSNINFRTDDDTIERTFVVSYVRQPDGSHYLQTYDSAGSIVELVGILSMAQRDILNAAAD